MKAPEKLFRIFLSYAHQDVALVDRLRVHLRTLERRGEIEVFSDRTLQGGDDWNRILSEQLAEADAVLFLMSADSLASEWVSKEIEAALSLHESRGMLVIPILLRPCYWSDSPLSRFQILPAGPRPVNAWSDPDEAFLNIVNAIRQLIGQTRGEPANAAEAVPLRSDLPTGYDRLHAAYLAVLENPALVYRFLQDWDQARFASVLDRATLERLQAKYPEAAPPALWTAWMLTVHAEQSGTEPGKQEAL